MNAKSEIEKYLLTELVMDSNKKSLDPDEDLLNQGIIDSMGVLQLVAFIEEKFAVEVADEDIVPENFRSINCLVSFVQKKGVNETV
ncbi:MAG: acyl carrier protein [bacterium]